MANTPFLNLVKPTDTDQALITDINNNSDKIDTGVSTLSEQIATYEIPTDTIANIEAALATYASGLANNEIRTVKFTVSTATTVFLASSYMGTIRKVATGRFNILVQGFLDESKLVMGNYRNSTWTWQQLATKNSTPTTVAVNATVPKNNGTVNVNYSSFGTFTNGHSYLVTVIGNNPAWSYSGILFFSGSATKIVTINNAYIEVTVDGTKFTLKNLHTQYDQTVTVEVVGKY